MAARAYSGKKPKNLKHTLRVFLSYLGRHKKMLAVVAVLVTISAGANLLGTYMIRPVVNGLADGDVHTLLRGVLITALIFGCGALAAYGYTQTMVKAAQQVVFDIRRDLFEHVQTLPLQFFDSRRHGDIMSLFTNDIDTMADALNNSFAMVIQSFIQIVGTLTLLYILNWRLSLIVTVCYGIMFWYIKFSGKRSKGYYTKQQNSLGELNGYIEELITGQKVVKVFHHEEESFTEFCKRMRSSGKREPARRGMRRRWFLSLSAFRMSIMRLWQCSAAFSPCTEKPISEAWQATLSLSARRRFRSTSSPSRATSFSQRSPVRSVSST